MTGRCRPSRWEEVPRLKSLWKECFGDEDTYIDHYFNVYYRPERALVLEVGGETVSMLLTFPFVITRAEGTGCPACYIYAFCTHPEERGRGYGRRLLAYAEEQVRRADCGAVVMVPGEESLFRFYESLGYEDSIFCREEALCQIGNGNYFPRPCSPEWYGQQREKWLTGLDHVSYPPEVLRYQHSLCRGSGGGFYELGDGVAAVEVDGDTLFIKELLTAEPGQAASALLMLLGGSKAEVRFPVLPGETGSRFGVVKWLKSGWQGQWQNGWMAFGFD